MYQTTDLLTIANCKYQNVVFLIPLTICLVVGKLFYLIITGLLITFVVHIVTQFFFAPATIHLAFYAILSILSLGFVFSPQVVGQICPLFQTLIGLEISVIDYPQPMMPRHIETVGMGHGYGRNTNFTNKKGCILYRI